MRLPSTKCLPQVSLLLFRRFVAHPGELVQAKLASEDVQRRFVRIASRNVKPKPVTRVLSSVHTDIEAFIRSQPTLQLYKGAFLLRPAQERCIKPPACIASPLITIIVITLLLSELSGSYSLPESYPLLDSPDPSKTQSAVGTMLCIWSAGAYYVMHKSCSLCV